MKKTTLYSLILWLVSLTAILGFGYYIYVNFDKYATLFHLSPTGVLLIFLIVLFFSPINGLQNTLMYRELGVDISYWDAVLLTTASTLANQLPISGGLISKGVYLKKRYGFSYTIFAGSTLALFVCFISASGFIGLAIFFYWIFLGSSSVPSSLLIGYLAMAFNFAVFWVPTHHHTWLPEKLKNKLGQIIHGWKILGKTPILLTKLIVLQVLLMFLLAVRYWLAFQMLSQNVTITQALLFASASILTQLVSIAPGGLGIRELIVGAVAGILGLDFSIGVLAIGLDRIVSTLVVFIIGWLSILLLGKQFTQNPIGHNENDPY